MYKKIQKLAQGNFLLGAFFLLGVLAYFASTEKKPDMPPSQFLPEPKSVDTFIPRGFVLVPIEITNAESLSSLVGDVGGVVDLYLASEDAKKKGVKVGTKLKLLRAPLNPQQYAVLVKDAESSRLLNYPGPFIAVVQNPSAEGTEIAQAGARAPSPVRVDYQN